MRQPIKDKNGIILGFFDDQGSKIAIMDREFRIQGFYDKKIDKTMDKNFIFIGNGNQLMLLLPRK